MSNTETVRTSTLSSNPIQSGAVKKLRSISGKPEAETQLQLALRFGGPDSAGILDAFAEVFARMAISESAPPTPEPRLEPVKTNNDAPAPQASNESSDRDSQSPNQNEGHDALLARVVETEITDAVTSIDLSASDNKPAEFDSDAKAVIRSDHVDSIETVTQHDELTVAEVETASELVSQDQSPTLTEQVSTTESDRPTISKKEAKSATGIQALHANDADDAITSAPTNKATDPSTTKLEAPEIASAEADSSRRDTDDRSRRRRRHDRENPGVNPASSPTPGAAIKQKTRSIPIPQEFDAKLQQASSTTKLDSTNLSDIKPPSSEAATRITQAIATGEQNSIQATRGVTSASRAGGPGSGSTTNPSIASGSSSTNRATTDSKPATRNAKSNTSDAVNRAKLIQRVSRAFQHLGPEGGQIRLRLAPAELGTIRLEMRVNNRQVQARVVAESEAAGNALREHLPELRQRLETQGIEVERFTIEVDSGDQEPRGSLYHGQGNADDRQQSEQPLRQHTQAKDQGNTVSRGVSRLEDRGEPLPTPSATLGIDVHL